MYGDNFGNGIEGGISGLNSVHGSEPFKNMNGGIVYLNDCYGNGSFQGMNSGIAFVREFKNKYKNIIGEHNGGTIITTVSSLSGDKALDKNILEGAVVFDGPIALQKWKSFSKYMLNRTPEWLAETYNKTILECNFEDPEIFPESFDNSLFQDTLKWTVPIDLEKENSGKVIIGDLLIKFSNLFYSLNQPKFYKDKIHSNVSEISKIGDVIKHIGASARKLRHSADEPILEKGYRGRLKVDDMSNEEIFNTLFKGGSIQQTLL